MVSVELGYYIDQNSMGESIDLQDKLEPQGISGAVRSTRDEGLTSQTLGMSHSESGSNKFNLDYVIPYVVTQVSRDYSPFYSEGDSIGLEDKLIGRDDILGKKEEIETSSNAADNVAMFFAQRGAKILMTMEKLRGEDFVARAKTLMRSGKMAPVTSPQGAEDMQIIGHLEQALSAFVRELNSSITPEANNFRQEIYAKLGTKSPEDVLSLYKKGLINPGIDRDHGYPKKRITNVLEKMDLGDRISWGFMRDLVKTLSDPEFRTNSNRFSRASI